MRRTIAGIVISFIFLMLFACTATAPTATTADSCDERVRALYASHVIMAGTVRDARLYYIHSEKLYLKCDIGTSNHNLQTFNIKDVSLIIEGWE